MNILCTIGIAALVVLFSTGIACILAKLGVLDATVDASGQVGPFRIHSKCAGVLAAMVVTMLMLVAITGYFSMLKGL